jgi:hypothetical protein
MQEPSSRENPASIESQLFMVLGHEGGAAPVTGRERNMLISGGVILDFEGERQMTWNRRYVIGAIRGSLWLVPFFALLFWAFVRS